MLQAAADIFFVRILVYPANYTIRPRQQDNLFITCNRTLKIWKKNSEYVTIMEDEPPLMRCPYPEKME